MLKNREYIVRYDMTLEKKQEIKGLIHREIAEMQRHKWIESEKAGKDLGDGVLFDWIERHENKFIKHYACS